MLRTGAIGLGAALAMTLTAAAQAQTSTSLTDGRTQTVVKVQDLNPATTTGATTLRMRLLSAAEQGVAVPLPPVQDGTAPFALPARVHLYEDWLATVAPPEAPRARPAEAMSGFYE